MSDAVKQTLLAPVYDVAIETPVDYSDKLSKQLKTDIYLKREDLQPVHSFKLRGAYNKIAHLTSEERAKGVIAASAGNHAQGVALSAQKLGIAATIVMPNTTPAIKVDAVKGYGAEVVLFGDNYSEAYEHCLKLVKTSGKTFIHPFDDPLVIAGQGTIGRELLEQLPNLTHVFAAVGGGGLITGIAQYIKQLKPDVKIIGVEPEDSNAMQASLKAKRLVTLDHVGIFADGVAVKEVGKNTFKLAQQYVDEVITVTNDQICAAIKSVFEDTRSIVEPAGALGVAGVNVYAQTHNLKKSCIVAVCSGANMTFERLQFITERTLIGSNKEALFSVSMPEKPGALEHFCREVVNGHSITEFNYRLNKRAEAHIFVGIGVVDKDDREVFKEKMKRHGYHFNDLSEDDIAKEHIRHMIGGASTETSNEHFYEINFPERPGALTDFLQVIAKRWNISLFHYRGQGADTGRVMIGFEAPSVQLLEAALSKHGYEYTRIQSAAAKIFL